MININGVTHIAVDQQTIDEAMGSAREVVRKDHAAIPAAALAVAESTGLRVDDIIDSLVDAAPVMTKDEDKRMRRQAAKGERKRKDARFRAFVRIPHDELARREALTDKKEEIRLRRQAEREVKEEEQEGDRPPLFTQLMGWADLIAQPEPKWLIESVIPEGGTIILYGASGVGKSFVAQSMSAAVAGGFGWLGRAAASGPVLYIFAEGASGAGKRFQAQADAWNKGKPIEGLHVLPVAPNLTHEPDVADLEALNREYQFAVIVYDTLNRVAGLADENSATAMGGVLNAIERIRRAGGRTTSIICHHANKSGEQRGSTAIWAAADSVLELTGEPTHLKLEARKQKDAAGGIVGHFRLKPSVTHDTLILEGVAPGQGTPTDVVGARVEEALSHFVRAFGETGCSRPSFVDLLVENGTAKKSTAQTYIGDLIRAGRLKTSTKGRSTWLTLAPQLKTFPNPN